MRRTSSSRPVSPLHSRRRKSATESAGNSSADSNSAQIRCFRSELILCELVRIVPTPGQNECWWLIDFLAARGGSSKFELRHGAQVGPASATSPDPYQN